MTANNEDSTQTYYTPPSSIFELVPYKNHIGEKVICVDDFGSKNVKVGEIYTVIDQQNEQYGYVRIDRYKDYPLMWFGPDRFRKCKASYDGREHTLTLAEVSHEQA
jgi:hypothetical protein